jgi:hypothetical protein
MREPFECLERRIFSVERLRMDNLVPRILLLSKPHWSFTLWLLPTDEEWDKPSSDGQFNFFANLNRRVDTIMVKYFYFTIYFISSPYKKIYWHHRTIYAKHKSESSSTIFRGELCSSSCYLNNADKNMSPVRYLTLLYHSIAFLFNFFSKTSHGVG